MDGSEHDGWLIVHVDDVLNTDELHCIEVEMRALQAEGNCNTMGLDTKDRIETDKAAQSLAFLPELLTVLSVAYVCTSVTAWAVSSGNGV